MKNKTNINGIVFIRNYYEIIKELEPEDQIEVYNIIFGFVFEGKEPVFLKKYLAALFTLIKPSLVQSINRYNTSVENGKKGGRKPSIIEPILIITVEPTQKDKLKEYKNKLAIAIANEDYEQAAKLRDLITKIN